MNGTKVREPLGRPGVLTGTTVDRTHRTSLLRLSREKKMVKQGKLAPTFHFSKHFNLCDLFEMTDMSKKSSKVRNEKGVRMSMKYVFPCSKGSASAAQNCTGDKIRFARSEPLQYFEDGHAVSHQRKADFTMVRCQSQIIGLRSRKADNHLRTLHSRSKSRISRNSSSTRSARMRRVSQFIRTHDLGC